MTDTEARLDGPMLARRLATEARRLIDILEQETKLLGAMDPVPLSDLLPEKREATLAYRALLGEAAEHPGSLAALDDGEKAQLKAAAEDLARATEANARALTAGIEANQRLVGAIAQAVRTKHRPKDSYQADGRRDQAMPNGAPPAVSFNHVL